MIICITGDFPIYDQYGDTGKTEFVVSHGYDIATGKTVILPQEPPLTLGAIFHETISEWVIL